MSTEDTSPARPRNLTDAVRARQARRGVQPAGSHDGRTRSRSTRRGHTSPRESSSRPDAAQQRGDDNGKSLLSRLLTPLKWLGGKLSDALETLVSEGGDLLSEHAGQLKKLGAMLAAGWLSKRLPGPVGSLARWLISGLSGDRGFGFWWLAVTLGIALAIGALVALLISPVAGLIALLVVGIWMLVQRARKQDDDDGRSDESDEGRSGDRDDGRTDDASDDAGADSERGPTAAPALA